MTNRTILGHILLQHTIELTLCIACREQANALQKVSHWATLEKLFAVDAHAEFGGHIKTK